MLESLEVAEPAAAAVFGSQSQRHIVLGLVDRERTLSELAQLTGMALNLLHHHVRKLERLGLISIARHSPRAGASIKYYRAVAQSFFVPAELMKSLPGQGLSAKLRQQLDASLSKSVRGVLFTHDEAGPRMRLIKEDHARGDAFELWFQLRLTREDALALEEELKAALKHFEGRSSPEGRPFLVHAALAPAD